MLAGANAIAFVDRTAMALLVDSIKGDLHLSDIQVGFLSGMSIVLFNAIVAVPIAWLADRVSRRNIIATALLLSGLATAAFGLSHAYAALFAARVVSGAAESAISPAAQSMLSDSFPKERLPVALGLFSMGIYVGNGLALLVGGVIVDAFASIGTIRLPLVGLLHPWQLSFLAASIPALLVAAATCVLKEPPRPIENGIATRSNSQFRLIWSNLRAHPAAYLGLFGAFTLLVMQGQGSSAWIPAFLARKFGWSSTEIGTACGAAVLICGTTGALLGGIVAGHLRRRGVADANLRTALAGLLCVVPFAVSYPLVSSPITTIILIGGMNFCAGFPFAGGYAALQELTPNRLRAQTTALFQLCLIFFGVGLGPMFVAMLTDFVYRDTTLLPFSLSLAALAILPLAVLFIALAIWGSRARPKVVRSGEGG